MPRAGWMGMETLRFAEFKYRHLGVEITRAGGDLLNLWDQFQERNLRDMARLSRRTAAVEPASLS